MLGETAHHDQRLIVARAVLTLLLLWACIRGECRSTAETGLHCFPPKIRDCSFTVLTTPMNETFSTYCIAESVPDKGPITYKWVRLDRPIDDHRTTVSASGSDYNKNISIAIDDMTMDDEDTYALVVANSCGKTNSSFLVLVHDGGCHGYETPNATHITSYSDVVMEGEYFEISCDFNGDVSEVHYEAQWNKGTWRDIVFNGPRSKYRSYRTTDCPSGAPCCSFTDLLVVYNANKNDSDWYTCVAWSVVSGSPQGINLSVYIVVAPVPEILHQPDDTKVLEGETVELSCIIKGFPNMTHVQWKRNCKAINTTTGSYTAQRHMFNSSDDVFVETIYFVAGSDTAGNYSCCVGVWQNESDTCTKHGTVTVTGGHHSADLSLAFCVGVGGGLGLLVLAAAILLTWGLWKTRKPHSEGGYRRINESQTIHYGSTGQHTHSDRSSKLINPVVSHSQLQPD